MASLQVVGCRDGVAANSILGCPIGAGATPLFKCCTFPFPHHIHLNSPRRAFLASAAPATSTPEKPTTHLPLRKYANPAAKRSVLQKSSAKETILDEKGLICNPRAARELAFSIVYAGVVSDEKLMRIFRQRLKQTPESCTEFSKDLLANLRYNCDDKDSIFVEDARTAKVLEHIQCKESSLEAAILSAPLTLVYSKSVLRLAQDIIQATEDSWMKHELVLTDLLPQKWKESGGAAAVQKCILHIAMSEMVYMSTPPKIVINEAVELGKRYSYGRVYRVISGCLWKFIESTYFQQTLNAKVVTKQ